VGGEKIDQEKIKRTIEHISDFGFKEGPRGPKTCGELRGKRSRRGEKKNRGERKANPHKKDNKSR